jgi:hypothetical protein
MSRKVREEFLPLRKVLHESRPGADPAPPAFQQGGDHSSQAL